MRLTRLRVKDFRAISEVDIAFPERGVTVLEGPNEAGKSSLLEAFNFLLEERHRTTSKKVQAARPLDRDTPSEIEAELCVGPYRLAVFKRFHPGAAGQSTLRIIEPRTETLTGDEAHNRLQQILDQHRDRTLWDALQVSQSGNLSQAVLAGSIALRSALDGAAGKQDTEEQANATLFARVQKEYERYFTATRANETGELAAARKASEAAVARAADLARKVQDLDSLVTSIEALEAESLRLEGEVGPAREDAERERVHLAEVERMESALEEREAAVQAAESALRAAEARWQQLQDLEHRLRDLATNTAEVESQETELEPRITQAAATLESAREARQQASDALEATIRVRSRAKDDEILLRTEFELAQELERLEQAELVSREREDALARVAGIRVDAGVLAQLRERAIDAAARRRQVQEGVPTITLTALAALQATANSTPLPLAEGQEARLLAEGPLTIHLPGVAEITITPPPSASQLADSSRAAESALASALREAGVTTLEEAEARFNEREALNRVIAEAPARIKVFLRDLPSLSKLREISVREAARLDDLRANLPPGYQPPTSITAAESRLHEAEELEVRERAQLDALRASEAQAREAHDRLRAQRDALESQLTVLQPQLSQARRQFHTAEAEQSSEELQQRTASAHEAYRLALEARDTERHRFQEAQPGAIRARAENALGVARGIENSLQRTRDTLIGERRVLEERSAEGLFELAEEAAAHAEHARESLAAVERRAEAARLLFTTLREARTAAQRRYAGPLSRTIDELGAILYGKGFRVHLGDDLTIQQRELDGLALDFDQLSGGAKEQLAILARVATAMLVQPGEGVPLVIDDALGYTDPERLKAMGAVLSLAGNQCQVIVLTCYPGRYQHVGGATVLRISG